MSANHRPLIGIPAASYDSSAPGIKTYRFNGNYTGALAAAGALPVAIPLNLPDDVLRELFDRLDGLLLAGGVDVDPVEYGETRHPALGEIDAARDETELKTARWALDRRVPTLAICRGIQVLNVAAGGNLYQDLPAQMPGALQHNHDYMAEETPWERPVHGVRVLKASRLADIAGQTELQTNSFHHQALKQVADGFVATAWAPDGVIEAIEPLDGRFALGIQWHPEAMTRVDAAARRIFQAFVAAAGAA